MVRWFLVFLALILALLGLLTVVKAPNLLTWKLAILAGEYGHVLALLPCILLATTWLFLPSSVGSSAGFFRMATYGLSVVAFSLFLLPVLSAARIGAGLPEQFNAVFSGNAREGPATAFSFARLFVFGTSRLPVEQRTFPLFGENGETLPFDFYRARNKTSGLAPCVIVIHGGGWDNGDRQQLTALNHHLAREGYAVAAIEYRLAPQSIWPAQRDDVLAVVEYIRSHAAELEVDPQKLVLLGRSAGGQLATAVAYGPRGAALFRGVIALYAPHDLEFAWKYSDVRDVLNSPRLMKQFLGGTPDTVRAAFVDASGYDQVTHSAPPTLLIHGKLDSLVWHRQSERLHERLDQLGVPNVFISLPWATHAFDFNPHGPGGQLSEFAIDEFLRRTTR